MGEEGGSFELQGGELGILGRLDQTTGAFSHGNLTHILPKKILRKMKAKPEPANNENTGIKIKGWNKEGKSQLLVIKALLPSVQALFHFPTSKATGEGGKSPRIWAMWKTTMNCKGVDRKTISGFSLKFERFSVPSTAAKWKLNVLGALDLHLTPLAAHQKPSGYKKKDLFAFTCQECERRNLPGRFLC